MLPVVVQFIGTRVPTKNFSPLFGEVILRAGPFTVKLAEGLVPREFVTTTGYEPEAKAVEVQVLPEEQAIVEGTLNSKLTPSGEDTPVAIVTLLNKTLFPVD
jgi:hypothetical protein